MKNQTNKKEKVVQENPGQNPNQKPVVTPEDDKKLEAEIKEKVLDSTPQSNEVVIPEETYKQIADDLNSGAVTKSEWIRRLLKMGVKRGKICKILDVQYPMVLGVEKRMLEQKDKPEKVKEDLPEDVAALSKTRIETGTSKSEVIRDLLKAGYGRAAIARGLNVPYPMVMGVEKRMNEVKPVDMDNLKAQLDRCTNEQLNELLGFVTTKLSEVVKSE